MLINQIFRYTKLFLLGVISIFHTQAQEITENNASEWLTFAEDGQSAIVVNVNNPDSVKQGNYSIRFDTESGFASGLSYPNTFPALNNTSWNVEDKVLKFYFYAINTSPYGFQQPLKVRLYSLDRFNYFEYNVTNQIPLNQWKEMRLQMSTSNQLFNTVGNPALNNINAIEFILDTWDYGFKAYFDGIEFVEVEEMEEQCISESNKYVQLKNLLLIIRNHNGNQLDVPMAEIKEVAEAMSEFYWKHSKQSLHLTWNYIEITENVEVWGNENSGVFSPAKVEQILSETPYLIADNTYDAVVATAKNGGNYGWTGGGNQLLGKAGFCHLKWFSNFFEGNRWTLIHEFNHTMDGLMLSSGKNNYPHNHPGSARVQGEYLPNTGPDSDLNAQILQSLCKADWLKLANEGNWGTIKTFTDKDEDGFADLDSSLPIDENRFGSSSNLFDTDNDLLGDLEEYYAGVHQSADPNKNDTDGDGIADGTDHQPLYAFAPTIPYRQTPVSSLNLSEYNFIGNQNGTDIYANYSDAHLHIAIANNTYISSGNFQLHIDLNNDGLFYGKDNLFLQFSNQQLVNLFLRNAAAVEAGNFSDYIQTSLPLAAIEATISDNNLFIAVAESNSLYNFEITAGNWLGLRLDNNNSYATLFENDDYLSFSIGESCAEELHLTAYTFGNYSYKAKESITATGELNNVNVNFTAGKQITLSNGFCSVLNTNFSAQIDECD